MFQLCDQLCKNFALKELTFKNWKYHIQPSKHTVSLKKNWDMEKCQGICSYKRAPTFVSLDNKVTV